MTSEPWFEHEWTLRVRYSETDQMGTFYNSRALEWFECARTELLRSMGTPYALMEERGVLLPLVEAHVRYLGRARYDDPLRLVSRMTLEGKASLRFTVRVNQAEGGANVCDGWTVHAVTGPDGRPKRCPDWLVSALCRPDRR